MAEQEIKLNICYGCMKKLPEGQQVCPSCGYDSSRCQNPENALPEGTVLLRKYLVGRVLGRGGFGITYLGYDLDLQLKVAIKEYFPREVCHRSAQSYDVCPESGVEDGTIFSKGREVFLDEARTLAKFNSPYIVHVRDFFREHGTAYIVMDYVDGITLKAEMNKNGGKLSYERVLSLMEPLIQQLDRLHQGNIIHRDIKPENIMLVDDENGEYLVLLDFGAAREYVLNETRTMTGVVTPGYSPLEQYSQKSRQGAYTDVYALCATMYHAITGVLPLASIERNVDGTPLKTFEECGVSVPKRIADAIVHGLALKSSERIQTMGQLQEEIGQTEESDSGKIIIYVRACALQEAAKTEQEFQRAIVEFRKIPGFRDADTRVIQCERCIDAIREEKRRKRKWKTRIILLTVFIVGVASGVLAFMKKPAEPEGQNGKKSAKESAAVLTQTPAPTQTPIPTPTPTLTPTPAPTPTADARKGNLSAFKTVGGIVTFGSYEQDNNTSNGKEDIEWIVLDIQDNKALLLSKYALDYKPFHNEKEDVTWETCSLREWLNADFLASSFKEEERQQILNTRLKNDRSQGMKDSVSGGNDTYDSVFLLSNLDSAMYCSSGSISRCVATQYVAAQGYTYESQIQWWLRNAGESRQQAGSIDELGFHSIYSHVYDPHGVRPAIWIELTGSSASDRGNSEKDAFRITGNTVQFGSYEQGYNASGRKDPIEWIVLDVQDNHSLLISRYALDCKPFHDTEAEVTWETSTLRSWLNNTFLYDAFSSEEQRSILKTRVDNSPEQGPKTTVVENGTEDLIFLLSGTEAEKYFSTDQERSCEPTYFARIQGALITANPDYEGNCTWWLRSPAGTKSSYYVGYDGTMKLYYMNDVSSCAVRPAIWVNNES